MDKNITTHCSQCNLTLTPEKVKDRKSPLLRFAKNTKHRIGTLSAHCSPFALRVVDCFNIVHCDEIINITMKSILCVEAKLIRAPVL